MAQIFEDLGFFIEYHVDNKYIGSLLVDNNDRKEIGYYSRKNEVAEQDILLGKNKVIKKGTKFHTYIYPLCGKKI